MIKDYTFISKDKIGNGTYKNGLYEFIRDTINTYEGD
jgi:hypothetical protein